MLNYIIWKIKKLFKRSGANELLPYRKYLYEELINYYGEDWFKNKNILEIGPRDGNDTERLIKLKPKKLVLIDLPQENRNNLWLKNINYNYEFIEKNFLYMDNEEIKRLGKFDLIYFTGVIYHNAEQLRFLQKLYSILNKKGTLVLESTTIKNIFLRNLNLVQIWYPNSFRDTTTITHLPSRKAIKSWLKMVGFNKILDSNCFNHENFNLKNTRYACIAEKNEFSLPERYYTKQDKNSKYYLGKAN